MSSSGTSNPRAAHREFAASLRANRRVGKALSSSTSTNANQLQQIVRLPTGMTLGFSVNVKSTQTIVTEVVKGGAADMAGVRAGSLLTSVDGTDVTSAMMSDKDVLALIVNPSRSAANTRSFGFIHPSHVEQTAWQVPAFKGDIGRLHVSQRQQAERLTRDRRDFDIGDETPEAV